MSGRALSGVLPILIIALLALNVHGADSEKLEPVLVIPSPRHDAGRHWEGETVTHTFEVKNGGTAELRILNVKPG